MLIKAALITKEQSHKQDTIRVDDISNIKIVFKLLIEVVTFYIELFIVEIAEFCLQLVFLMVCASG